MSDEIELLPCPFCGGDGVSMGFRESVFNTVEYFIKCITCGARTSGCSDDKKAENAWNTRQLDESKSCDKLHVLEADLLNSRKLINDLIMKNEILTQVKFDLLGQLQVLKEENEALKRHSLTPHKCPVCDGTGRFRVPNEKLFPNIKEDDSWLKSYAECNPCEGKGVLWR